MHEPQTGDLEDEDALFERAKRLHDADRHADALPLWQILTAKWPAVGYWMYLSICLSELERWEEMEAAAREALELAPESLAMWRSLAKALDAQDRPREAREAYERSLAIQDNRYTRVLYASMLTRHGDIDEARQQLEACVRNFPEWEEGWFNLGSSWELDDPERALRLMQSALEIDPADGYYHAGVAYMHAILAHVDEARHHLREARRLGSAHADLEGLLGKVSAWLQGIDRKCHARAKRAPE